MRESAKEMEMSKDAGALEKNHIKMPEKEKTVTEIEK